MTPQFFIGFDIGHGETCVSRIPGYNGESISRIPLRNASQIDAQKVISAICRDDDGKWRFVTSTEDLASPDTKEGFKGLIHTRTAEQKEALAKFTELVFKAILDNDKDLKYDPLTGEANFIICIANPSDWRRQNAKNPQEYLDFFRKEAGLPAWICVNESDAAFYTKHDKYHPSDTVFVIDLGSSTIDFTTYNNSKCLTDLCWGANCGAHTVEDLLLEKSWEDNNNLTCISQIDREREVAGQGSSNSAISLAMRMAKEQYYYNSPNRFRIIIYEGDLIAGGHPTKEVFSLALDKDQFTKAILEYTDQLELEINNAAQKLLGNGISPTHILLSGGASRMPFVSEITQKAFPNAIIDVDTTPEWIVSDGAAKYVEKYYNALIDMTEVQKIFTEWAQSNLADTIKKAGLAAFQNTLKQEMENELTSSYVNQETNTTLDDFTQKLIEILPQITHTDKFVENANNLFITSVNDQISSKVEDIIKNQYNKNITINTTFIDPNGLFRGVPVETDHIESIMKDIGTELFAFITEVNMKKNRDFIERKKILDKALDIIPQCYVYDFVQDISEMITEANVKIEQIIKDNGLFQISE